jgi:hypothetical protein
MYNTPFFCNMDSHFPLESASGLKICNLIMLGTLGTCDFIKIDR